MMLTQSSAALLYSRVLEELLTRLHGHVSPATLACLLVLALVLASTIRMLVLRLHRRAEPVALAPLYPRRSLQTNGHLPP